MVCQRTCPEWAQNKPFVPPLILLLSSHAMLEPMADYADMCEDDADALKRRRKDLYAFMQELTAAAAMLPSPETYLEAMRAVQAITTADRFIQTLDLDVTPKNLTPENVTPLNAEPDTILASPTPAAPTSASMRKGLRQLADRIMAAVKTIPMPDNAITVWRALRYASACERMLTQLYAAPQICTPAKPKPEPKPALPAAKRSSEEIRAYYQQIERELWEKFSQSPQAQSLRAAKQRAAQSAFEAEPAELAAPKQSEGPASRHNDQTPPIKPMPP
jgi:hypothetical protein